MHHGTVSFLFTTIDSTSLLVLPWLAQDAPKLLEGPPPVAVLIFILVASVVFALGGILLAIGAWRAKLLPLLGMILLIAGAVLNIANFPLPPGIPSAIVSSASLVLFSTALAWMGYTLISSAAKPAEAAQPTPAPTA